METRDRPESLEGLPSFLVEHEKCDKGFDVTHPEGLGAGVIAMTCRSCGESFEFVPTKVEVEREIVTKPVDGDPIELKPKQAPPKKSLQASAGAASAGGKGRDEPPRKRRSARSRRDRITVALLLVFAIAAFAFAIFRVLNEDGESGQTETAASARKAAPTTPAPAPAAGAESQPRQEEPVTKPREAARPAPRPAPATRRAALAGGTIAVPADWSKTNAGDATVLAPKAGPRVVSIRYFNEANPGLSAAQMIAGTQGFLSSQAPNGAALPVRRTRIGGDPAFTTGEKGPAGYQEALGVVAGANRYLLIGTADPAATGVELRQMRRALTSFRPR